MEYNSTTMCGNFGSIYVNLMTLKDPDWLTPEMSQYLLDDMAKINRTAEKAFLENCQTNSVLLSLNSFFLMGGVCLSLGVLADSALKAKNGLYKESFKTAACALTCLVPTFFALQADPCLTLTHFMKPLFEQKI